MLRPPCPPISLVTSCVQNFQGWYKTEIICVACYQRYIPSKDMTNTYKRVHNDSISTLVMI